MPRLLLLLLLLLPMLPSSRAPGKPPRLCATGLPLIALST
jgi:hypothetical protein